MHWQEQGKQPDYRFSLANERTFLAWIRTALGILAGAVLLHQLAQALQPRWVSGALAIALAVIPSIMAAAAFFRWRQVEIAMRHDRPLPRSALIAALATAVSLVALAVALFLALQ